jgi:hypothetical protein
MKKTGLILLSLLALQNYAFSQNPLERLTGNSKLMFGPTWSNWIEVPSAVEVKPARNIGFDVAAIQRFGEGTVGFNAGLGISAVNIHSNIFPWQFDGDGNVDSIGIVDMDKKVDGKNFVLKNKLALTYLEVPLELSIRTRKGEDTDSTNAKTRFKFAIGWRTGICIDAHVKQKTRDYTWKIKDFDNITMLRYGPTIRIGYGAISLYGRYDLSSSFQGEKVPAYTLYTVGVMISQF